MKFKYILAFAFFCLFTLPSCGHDHKHGEDGHNHSHDGDASAQKGKEFTSAYICPMYCEGSGSDKEGKCPVCKMDYIVNKKKDNDHGHEGHDHGDGHGHDHDHDHDHGHQH